MEDYNTMNSFPRPNLPDGFRTILYSLSREVLREQPADIYAFCAEFFGKQLLTRGDSWINFRERYQMRSKEKATQQKATLPEPITEDTVDTVPITDTVETAEEEESAKTATPQSATSPLSLKASKASRATLEKPHQSGSRATLGKPRPSGSRATLQKSRESMTEEEKSAIVIIQAGVRGMLARKSLPRMVEQYGRRVSSVQELTPEELERWEHPQEQMEKDLTTSTSAIDFARLKDDSEWQEIQRWLHPEDQLARDFTTDSEPVELAHTRDRTSSLEGVNWWENYQRWTHPSEQLHHEFATTTGDNIDYADTRDRTFSVMDIELPPPPDPDVVAPPAPPASPAHSDIDVAGTDSQAVDAGKRANSPPEALTPVRSSVAMINRSKHDRTPSRTGSVPSVKSVPHSDVDLAGAESKQSSAATKRGSSMESADKDRSPPADGVTPPPTPLGINTEESRQTASSPVELGSEHSVKRVPTDRAGSPPEVGSPAHSDVDLPNDRPSSESKRADSPVEPASAAHSNVEVPSTIAEIPSAAQQGTSGQQKSTTSAHSDTQLVNSGDRIGQTGRAGSQHENASPGGSQQKVAEEPATAEEEAEEEEESTGQTDLEEEEAEAT